MHISWLVGATAARLTPDQKAGGSNPSLVIFAFWARFFPSLLPLPCFSLLLLSSSSFSPYPCLLILLSSSSSSSSPPLLLSSSSSSSPPPPLLTSSPSSASAPVLHRARQGQRARARLRAGALQRGRGQRQRCALLAGVCALPDERPPRATREKNPERSLAFFTHAPRPETPPSR